MTIHAYISAVSEPLILAAYFAGCGWVFVKVCGFLARKLK